MFFGLRQSACIHADQVACWSHFDRGHLGVLVSFVDHRRCEKSDIVDATGGLARDVALVASCNDLRLELTWCSLLLLLLLLADCLLNVLVDDHVASGRWITKLYFALEVLVCLASLVYDYVVEVWSWHHLLSTVLIARASSQQVVNAR